MTPEPQTAIVPQEDHRKKVANKQLVILLTLRSPYSAITMKTTMKRRHIVPILLLLASTCNGFAQQAHDLQPVLEGSSLGQQKQYSSVFPVATPGQGNSASCSAQPLPADSPEWDDVGDSHQLTKESSCCPTFHSSTTDIDAVRADDIPPAPQAISGPDTVCPLSSAVYTATPTSPDYYILWEWTMNGDTLRCSGNKANITFEFEFNDIRVYQVNRRTGLRSEPTTLHVSLFQLAEWPYRKVIRLCQGQHLTLSSLRDQSDYGVLYEWTVKPADFLSIQGSHLEAGVTLLANYSDYNPPIVLVLLKRTFCYTYWYDTVFVRIGEIDPPTITHGPVCAGQSTTFTVANPVDADSAATYWYFDNHPESPIYGLAANPVFDDTLMHTVHLHYVSRYGCQAETHVTVVPHPPLPLMHIDTCGHQLSVVVDDDPANYSYLWMTGDTTRSIEASPGDYWCIVTDPRCGCSQRIPLDHKERQPDCTPVSSAFRIANYGHNIIGIRGLNAPGLQYPLSLTLSQNNHHRQYTVSGRRQRIMVPDTGNYSVTVTWTDGDSCHHCTVGGYIPQAVIMQVANDCRGHLVITSHLNDGVPIKMKATVSEAQHNNVAGRGSGVGQCSIAIPDTGWYRVHVVFQNRNCFIDTLIHFHAAPTIRGLNVKEIMCEETAFTFSADAIGHDLTYRWDFNDGSWNYGNGIDHVYGYPTSLEITLTVTDPDGCSAIDKTLAVVHSNYLSNNYLFTIQNHHYPDCPGDSMVLCTAPHTDLIYSWSPCSQFTGYVANVYQAGTYLLNLATTFEQCRKQYAINMPYPNGPFASILCDSSYSLYDQAELVGNVGSEYTYQWYLHSAHAHDSATTANLHYHLADTGLHQVVLLVSDTNGCSASDTAYFYVHPTPAAASQQSSSNSTNPNAVPSVRGVVTKKTFQQENRKGEHLKTRKIRNL